MGCPNAIWNAPFPVKITFSWVRCCNAANLSVLLAPEQRVMKGIKTNIFSNSVLIDTAEHIEVVFGFFINCVNDTIV